MFVVARAGMSELAPENTMAAYLKCVDTGVGWFQADVRALADNSLIMARDEEAARTTNGSGLFSQMEFGDLRRLDAGAWFSPTYRFERIPELTSVVELLNSTALSANLELHVEDGASQARQVFVETVAQVLQSLESPDRLLISSRHPDLLSRLTSLGVQLPLALTVTDADVAGASKVASDLGCRAVILRDSDATQQSVAALSADGLEVWVGVIDDLPRAVELREWGVAAVITDRAEELKAGLAD